MPRIAVLLLLLLVACGGRATEAPSPAEPVSAEAPEKRPEVQPEVQIVRLFEELSRDLAQAGAACPRVAEVLTAWTADQRPGYAALMEQVTARELPAEQLARYEDRLAAALTAIMDSATQCETHEEVQITFRAFDEMVEAANPGN